MSHRQAPSFDPSASALYRGVVMHQRLRPMRHQLRYRIFTLWLDMDELPSLERRLRWFSIGRFNLFSFRPSDHGDGQAPTVAALRAQMDAHLAAAGLPVGGPLRLLTLPRLLGYAFNPLTVWFSHAPSGELQAIIYEVNNTFGQRHSYLATVDDHQREAATVHQRCDKLLYVSPFLGMDLHYRFRIDPPGERLSLGISVHDNADGTPVLNARHDAERGVLSDRALLGLFFSYPLLTLKVIVGIHWEALRLWLKGARLHERTRAPEAPLTVVRPAAPLPTDLP
ncbi:DUF1365 family protein [Roseateles sp. SL47]|uniref:DUF1365 domain-containing protein n=1 Tax=Roseateles sp. SL47 TaxID=2995138 RepID=UPI002270B054|nr:DUF1365 family protein [Roseateles sp. SL47]WAC71739.1 DUF1365 family protein [Roseateles sp. SL47]